MIHEVRVFDGQGNLKEVITEFDCEPTNIKKYQEHVCNNSQCQELTTRKNYCSTKCADFVGSEKVRKKREAREEERRNRPQKYCVTCDSPLIGQQKKFCTAECGYENRKMIQNKLDEQIRINNKKKKGEINASRRTGIIESVSRPS